MILTGHVSFCEEDYAVTLYIAEFINALSSLSYSYLAYRLPQSSKHPHSRLQDPLSLALFLVGIASTAYHATLRQGLQFADDLSMLFLGACLLHAVYSHRKSTAASRSIAMCLAIGTLGVSIAYIRSGNIMHHFLAFSAMVHLLWPRTVYLISYTGRPESERRVFMRKFWKSAGLLVSAFVIWNIDLEWCLRLRDTRGRVGLPWGWLLEMHGWWYDLPFPLTPGAYLC